MRDCVKPSGKHCRQHLKCSGRVWETRPATAMNTTVRPANLKRWNWPLSGRTGHYCLQVIVFSYKKRCHKKISLMQEMQSIRRRLWATLALLIPKNLISLKVKCFYGFQLLSCSHSCWDRATGPTAIVITEMSPDSTAAAWRAVQHNLESQMVMKGRLLH